MPVFASTAKMMAALSRDEDVMLGELSKLVLQDTGMTSSVLKRANSAWHYTKPAISTRARPISSPASWSDVRSCGSTRRCAS